MDSMGNDLDHQAMDEIKEVLGDLLYSIYRLDKRIW